MDERADIQFKIRLPAGLKDRLEESAYQNRRSVTAEIIERLETTFEVDLAGFQRDREELSALLNRHSQMEATMRKLIALLEDANERAARSDQGRHE